MRSRILENDLPLPDTSVQVKRVASATAHGEATKRSGLASEISMKKMQTRLRLLEDSNAALHVKNRDLIAGNKSLERR
jgi:hypothetical protein